MITLSPEAQHKAMELTRTQRRRGRILADHDPTIFEGSREQRLAAYREVRDELMRKIKARFSVERAGDV